ncbi:MAG TPA: DUF1552 domain-containing protein [Alphaproteobacteria bacterium]|nr:DUF1552 domain-containing protein [Alphaproteobacteria bacterium]
MTTVTRRAALKGMMGGAAVTIGLPFLDCFLNGNGTALAAGGRLPIRFGTWFWGCGMTPDRFVPKTVGAHYDIPVELEPMGPFKDQTVVLTGFKAILDGRSNFPHTSGNISVRTGSAPDKPDEFKDPTIDILIGDVIGTTSRFRSLEVSATGDPRHSYSSRSLGARNPAEVSPVALYTRIFGPEFQDPNAADFKPDPKVMLRKSVLSAVAEHRARFMRDLGAADKARLDEYFSSLRQLEQQLDLQLQKPPPAEACVVPRGGPKDGPVGTEIGEATANHALMAQLIAMALACNQTRVFNVVFSDSASSLRKEGSSTTHHQLTHEEQVDSKLGYQPQATWFVEQSMAAWGAFARALAAIKEGDGTLLDNMLVMAHSDTQFAKTHSVDGVPVMLLGKAGGKIRTGLHIDGNGDPISRIGLTVQQIMGVSVDKWGSGSMQTSKSISEILV